MTRNELVKDALFTAGCNCYGCTNHFGYIIDQAIMLGIEIGVAQEKCDVMTKARRSYTISNDFKNAWSVKPVSNLDLWCC